MTNFALEFKKNYSAEKAPATIKGTSLASEFANSMGWNDPEPVEHGIIGEIAAGLGRGVLNLSLIHISEPTRPY